MVLNDQILVRSTDSEQGIPTSVEVTNDVRSHLFGPREAETAGIHARRVARCDRDYWRARGSPVAGCASRPRIGPPHAVHQQAQAAFAGAAQLRRYGGRFSAAGAADARYSKRLGLGADDLSVHRV